MREKRKEYIRGIVIAFLGVSALSFDALLIRLSGYSGLTASFWRSFFTFISLTLIFFTLHRKASFTLLKAGGWPMWISGLMWGLSGLFFTLSVQKAGSAPTLVLLSFAPLFSSAFSYLFYKQKPSLVTMIATLVSIGALYFIFKNGLEKIAFNGVLFALLTPLVLGSNLSFMRNHHQVSRTAIVMVGGFLGVLIALIASQGELATRDGTLWPLALLGLVAIPFAQIMISSATRYIPSSESALINSLETVLGISYVALFLKEMPTTEFIIGAVIIFIAISANSAYQIRLRKYQE